MRRFVSDPRWLLLIALLAAPACTRRVLPLVNLNPYAFSSPAESEAAWVNIIATGLQLNPATDPVTRADPYPCARATYAAQQRHTPLPPCYYLPTGTAPMSVGWLP
jgi:hypothetical protein